MKQLVFHDYVNSKGAFSIERVPFYFIYASCYFIADAANCQRQ